VFLDQDRQIRFQSSALFRRMAQQRFNQPAFPQAEMSMNPSMREPVQSVHGLLGEKLFQFVSGHFLAVKSESHQVVKSKSFGREDFKT
jgi:hypothetical protein